MANGNVITKFTGFPSIDTKSGESQSAGTQRSQNPGQQTGKLKYDPEYSLSDFGGLILDQEVLDAAIEAILDPLVKDDPPFAAKHRDSFYIDVNLQPDEILLQKQKRFSESNFKHVSYPYKDLAFDASSSPLTELLDFDDMSITESNVDFVKYDYICGVSTQFPPNGQVYPCLEKLSCKNHTLSQKLGMLRSKPIERLIGREEDNSGSYDIRRELVMRALRSKLAPKRMLIQPAFRTQEITSSINESLILGIEIPLNRNVSGVRKRRIIEPLMSATLGKRYKFSRSFSNTVSEQTSYSSSEITNTLSDTKGEEQVSDVEGGETRLEYSNVNTTQSFDSSYETTRSLHVIKAKTVEFLKKLSMETGTRLVETMAYLHLKLNPLKRYNVPTRAKRIRDRIKSTYFET